MKIGLLQGNGSDLIGGGSIQLEYNLWANSQEDIELTNLVYSVESTNYYSELELNGRLLTNVQEFNESTDITLFKQFDKLIILTYPTIADEDLSSLAKWYKSMLKLRENEKLWTGVICYDYKKDVVLANLGAKFPDLYRLVDVIWVNNKKNPLIDFLKDIDTKAELLIECPQFMNDTKLEWVEFEDKVKSQMYYQGRSLDWKGWKEILPLKKYLEEEDLLVNMTFNGITEIPKTDIPFVIYEEFNKLAIDGYSKQIDDFVRLYGMYSPKTANQLTSEAMFGVYFTNLDPRDNFLPEYAFIDFIRNGTVLIVPDWYFDGKLHPLKVEYNIIDKSPSEVGMLTWNPTNKESTKELAKSMKKLMSNKNLYNEYRSKAFKYMLESHGANNVIRKFLNKGEK